MFVLKLSIIQIEFFLLLAKNKHTEFREKGETLITMETS